MTEEVLKAEKEEVRVEGEVQALEKEIKELKGKPTTQEIDRQTQEIN